MQAAKFLHCRPSDLADLPDDDLLVIAAKSRMDEQEEVFRLMCLIAAVTRSEKLDEMLRRLINKDAA